jgi:hypothetical protein
MSGPNIPDEWKAVATDTARALSIARYLADRQATDETTETDLLPALVMAATLRHVTHELCNRIEGIYDALSTLSDPMLTERLAGIENELYRLANVASDAQRAGALTPSEFQQHEE